MQTGGRAEVIYLVFAKKLLIRVSWKDWYFSFFSFWPPPHTLFWSLEIEITQINTAWIERVECERLFGGLKGQSGTVSDHICCGGSKGKRTEPWGTPLSLAVTHPASPGQSGVYTSGRDRRRGGDSRAMKLQWPFCPAAQDSQTPQTERLFLVTYQISCLSQSKLRSPLRVVNIAWSYQCFGNLLLALFLKTFGNQTAMLLRNAPHPFQTLRVCQWISLFSHEQRVFPKESLLATVKSPWHPPFFIPHTCCRICNWLLFNTDENLWSLHSQTCLSGLRSQVYCHAATARP